MLILSNPAKISQINSSIFFQSSYFSTSERRSMIITDMWGDFLTNADYVFNDNGDKSCPQSGLAGNYWISDILTEELVTLKVEHHSNQLQLSATQD